MPLPLGIDHAVVAVRDLDAAAADFSALGFTLTPRGVHSIGSQNHCIMLGSTYLELLAAPVEHAWLEYYRRFLHEHADGLAAIALATDDADATYTVLRAQGVAARPPMDLSRPVEGGMARFRLVQIDGTPALFVCQHLTRARIWRREWQAHANGACELVGVSLPAVRPFPGLPECIEWRSMPALRVRGLERAFDAHGVHFAAC